MSQEGAQWRPQREIEIVAGTPPGGGLDRTARALLFALESEHLLDVPARVTNVPGDGARKAWTYMDRFAGDPHVLSISSPNLTTDHLTGIASFDHSDYTPIAILSTEYIAFITRPGSGIDNAAALLERLAADAGALTVALATAAGNPNHIALARLARHAGANPRAVKVRIFDSAPDAVGDVAAGKAEVGAVSAASAVAALAAGTVVPLGVSAPERLPGPYSSAPAWVELSVDCIVGAWRGVTGARALTPAQTGFWAGVLAAAVGTAAWREALVRHYWSPMYLDGADLRSHVARETAELRVALGYLGLLR